MVKLYQAEKGGRLDGVAGLAASAPTVPVIVDSSLSLYPFFLLSVFLLSLSLFFLLFLLFLCSPFLLGESIGKKGNFIVADCFPANRARRGFLFYFIFTPAGVDTPRRKRKNEETKRRVNSGRFSLQNSTSKRPVDQAG